MIWKVVVSLLSGAVQFFDQIKSKNFRGKIYVVHCNKLLY